MADSTTVYVENPFSFQKFIEQADAVSITVLIVLGLMSLASWYVILTKFWDQGRIRGSYREMQKKFWAAGNIREGVLVLSGGDNVFRMLAEDGMRATQLHEGHLSDRVDLNDWITVSLYRSAESVAGRLNQGMAILATTGSVSPFVGLLGTVWGIYNALTSIAMAGQPSIDRIAGPIGEALIMTAFGLFVAVPAVMGYNWLLRRNKDIHEKMKYFSADLHTYLLGGVKPDASVLVLRPRPTAAAKPA